MSVNEGWMMSGVSGWRRAGWDERGVDHEGRGVNSVGMVHTPHLSDDGQYVESGVLES